MTDRGYLSEKISGKGIRYFLEENHTFPSVSIGVFVRSGARYEELNHLGISHFIEHTVFKGTEKRTAFDISHSIEKAGGELNAYTSVEYSLFYVRLLSKDAEIGFDILSDILSNPTFNKELIERERGVIIEEIQEYYDDPQDICQTESLKSIWGEDPIANSALGVEDVVKGISRDDLEHFFKRYFNKDNIFISISGDMSSSAADNLVDRYFGSFNPTSFVPQVSTPEYNFQERKVSKDNAQVHLSLTFKGSRLFSDDNLMNSIFTTILGGNMSSRLFQKLREDKGLVYTIYSYPVKMTDAGATVIYASTMPKYVNSVEQIILEELELVRKKGFLENEFSDAKNYITGSIILGLESISQRMQRNGVQGLFLGKIKETDVLMDELNSIQFDQFEDYAGRILDSGIGKVLVGKL
ncbi:MAG: M16 family metallopeptidase [Caldisericaceae bacterium]